VASGRKAQKSWARSGWPGLASRDRAPPESYLALNSADRSDSRPHLCRLRSTEAFLSPLRSVLTVGLFDLYCATPRRKPSNHARYAQSWRLHEFGFMRPLAYKLGSEGHQSDLKAGVSAPLVLLARRLWGEGERKAVESDNSAAN
jgi:hypothetical protein